MKDLRYFEEYVARTDPALIVHSKREISPRYEISALIKNLGANIGETDDSKAPAVFFENVKDSKIPVLCNLFGNRRIMALALEANENQLIDRLTDSWRGETQPKLVDGGPIQDIVEKGTETSISHLPVVTHCEGDVSPYITAGLMIIADPDTGRMNMGIYRFRVEGERQLGANLVFSHDAYGLFRKNEIKNKDLDVAIVIGHHPAVYLASQSYDKNISEVSVAGTLLNEPLALTRGITVDLELPAYGEIAIEGKIKAGKRETDGPFGEYAGYYCSPTQSCVIEITAITRRKDARYVDIYNEGVEHVALYTVAVEALVRRRLVEMYGSQIVSVRVPPSGVGHLVHVSLDNPYEGLVRNVGLAALTVPHIKICVVHDKDIDLDNPARLNWSFVTRTDPDRSITFIPDAYASGSDPMSYSSKSRSEKGPMSTKMIIDATRPKGRFFPEVASPPMDVLTRIKPSEFIPSQNWRL